MSLDKLLEEALPMNRKERFFTGTVFPMIVCADDFAHIGRFLTLAGVEERSVEAGELGTNIQFFTEYGFAESRFTDAGRLRFPDYTLGRDTPDVLMYIGGPRPLLLAVEAKMYDVPDRVDLEKQLARQKELLDYIAQHIRGPEIRQVALIPEQLTKKIGTLSYATVSWQQLATQFADVGSDYFLRLLRRALDDYDDLVSRKPVRVLGEHILAESVRGSFKYKCVGRQDGAEGLLADLVRDRWKSKAYSCAPDPVPPNANWFTVDEFVEIVSRSGRRIGITPAQ